MTHSSSLYRLQQTDNLLEKARARLNSIVAELENDVDLKKARQDEQQAVENLAVAKQVLSQSESVEKDQRIKIEQIESNLYGGRVHNPKELQDLQNDVASLKRHLETLENRHIEAMLEQEAAEAFLLAIQDGLATLTAHSLQKNQSLVGEQLQIIAELENLESERAAMVAGIQSELLNRYEALRTERRGVAVANVNDNSCSACGSTLTPSHIQNARLANEIVYCPTCGRILYCS
jgi:hypothetical protein